MIQFLDFNKAHLITFIDGKEIEMYINVGDKVVFERYKGTDIKPVEGKVIAFTFDDGPSYTKSTKMEVLCEN